MITTHRHDIIFPSLVDVVVVDVVVVIVVAIHIFQLYDDDGENVFRACAFESKLQAHERKHTHERTPHMRVR